MIIIELKCNFCSEVVGSFQFHEDTPQEKIDAAVSQVADSRCDSCEKQHGNYKEMADRFELETGLSHEEFKKIITESGGKKSSFETLLEAKKAELITSEKDE